MHFNFPVLATLGLVTLAMLAGCGGGSSTVGTPVDAPVVLTPACSNPVPLGGSFEASSPGYTVRYVAGTDIPDLTAQLGAKYGFTGRPFTGSTDKFIGFSASLSPQTVAALRCDPSVASIEYNMGAGGGTGS